MIIKLAKQRSLICQNKNTKLLSLELYEQKTKALIECVVQNTRALSHLDEEDKDDDDTRAIVNLMRNNNVKHNIEIETWREKAAFATQHIKAYKVDHMKVRI